MMDNVRDHAIFVMDVQGNSYGWGAEIDAWYPNNGLNQVFSMPGQPGF